MVDVNKEVAEKIRDGSYYKDAREWYFRHYLFPVTERLYVLIIAVLVTFLFTISVQNIYALHSENEVETPIIIKAEDSTSYFSMIKPLAKKSDSTQDAVSRYLISDYLRTREEYNYREMQEGNKLRYNLKKIKSSSSKNVLNEYRSYMNETNPYSPITRYKDHTNRAITIQSFNFTDNTSGSGKAKIIFEATEKKRGAEAESKSLFEATVHFRLPDIETISKTGAPLRFLINYYNAKPAK